MTKTENQIPLHVDVAIVGAGSAGALLAARLSEDASCHVLVIEAGDEPQDPDIWTPNKWPALQGRRFDRDYVTEPQAGTAGRVHRWARGKVVGGSSCLHAMGYMRGHPQDYQSWVEATGDPTWSWSSLLPVFQANEDHPLGGDGIHGKTGPMPVYIPSEEISPLAHAFIGAGAALGLARIPGHNGGEMIGVTPNSLNIHDGRRVTVADAWLTPSVRSRNNLVILTGHQVLKLNIQASRARSLDVVGPRGGFEVIADRIILCAGALESPALLMRSGIGPSDVLRAAGVRPIIEVDAIGSNLQDHLLGAANLYESRKPIPSSRLQHSESMAYMKAGDFNGTGQPEIVVGCGVAPIVSECFEAPAEGLAYSLLFGITHPTSRGTLRITGPGLADRLLIDPAYLQTEHDRRLFRQALEAARAIGHHDMLAEWRKTELLPDGLTNIAEIDAFIAKAVITHHHPCGTCRMGNDRDAVVDTDLRLQALDNLHVVDASVMPSLTAGPIHAAILAIAERFARSFTGIAI